MREGPVKILFVLPWLESGGSERVVLDLARHLDRKRYCPLLFAIQGGPLEAAFREEGIEVVLSRKRPGTDHLRLMGEISGTLTTHGVRILAPHHVTPLLYAWLPAKRAGARILFTCHVLSEMTGLPPLLGLAVKGLLKGVHACVAISSDLREGYARDMGVRPGRVVYIPNAVDIARFARPPEVREEKRRDLGIGPGRPVIGAVANFRAQKNHEGLVHAFQQVLGEIPEALLLLVGSGERESAIRSLCERLGVTGSVLFLGSRRDVPDLYRVFDVFCLPSHYEGLPLCILEAMAGGLPIVATEVTGTRDVLRSDVTGLLVPPGDPAALAGALIRTLRSPELRLRLGEAAYREVFATYGIPAWVARYEALFEALLQTGRPGVV